MESSHDPPSTARPASSAASRGEAALPRERELLRRLQRAEEQLGQKDRELEQFLHTVSHDLKSPLVTIVGFLDILAQDLDAGRSEQNLEIVGRIRRAGMHMSRLIEGLLQLSRIDALRLRPQWVDVAVLVRELLRTSLAAAILDRGARVEVQADLPRAFADPRWLGQVLENLLSNALEHGRPGAEERPIEIGGQRLAGETRFFVRDHGPGIPSQHHQRIFTPFQTLGSTSRTGAGLGLAIVERTLTAHGGRAWIESVPGSGATFWIALPHEVPSQAPA